MNLRKALVAAILGSIVLINIEVLQAAVSVISSAKTLGAGNGAATIQFAGINPNAGDTMAVCWHTEGTETGTVDDTTADVWSSPVTSGNQGLRANIAYALNSVGGSRTVTITLSGNQYRAGYIVILRGVASAGQPDDSDVSDSAGENPATGAASNASQAGIALGCLGTLGNTTIAPGAGWTEIQENQDGSNDSTGAFEYQLTTASNSYTPNWSSSNGEKNNVVGVILKETVASTKKARFIRLF